mmetsp:Transcript_46859/g.75522  ORF Transcript_46859/g.75522 Transcript_46859/m.75522 type:complete len:103 (+) Transcript_46859:1878-2186(+)
MCVEMSHCETMGQHGETKNGRAAGWHVRVLSVSAGHFCKCAQHLMSDLRKCSAHKERYASFVTLQIETYAVLLAALLFVCGTRTPLMTFSSTLITFSSTLDI